MKFSVFEEYRQSKSDSERIGRKATKNLAKKLN